MSKRKISASTASDDDGDSSDVSIIDVSFDFFDPNPDIDYHAIKHLLAQLFHHDASLFSLHELTELILSQPTVGTTIKTDGLQGDPYALLTVLNMHVHHKHPSIKAIANYCLEKAASSSSAANFHAQLNTLFSQPTPHVGLVVCERLVNMPVQVVPPMYKMLTDELAWAVADGEPYTFSHLLFVSRTYHLSPDEESALANSSSARTASRRKNGGKKSRPSLRAGDEVAPPEDRIYSYHPEDDVIKEFATHTLNYTFSTTPTEPRKKDAFGLDYRGRMMLVPAERFAALVAKIAEVYTAKE